MTYTTDASSYLPGSGTIVGVEVKVHARAGSTGRLIKAGPTALLSNIATQPVTAIAPAAASAITFGGPTNTLGVTSISQLDSIKVEVSNSTTSVAIDCVEVTVYWSGAGNATRITLTVDTAAYLNSYWSNPTNALVANNSYASIAPGAGSRHFVYTTNVTAVIPADVEILGAVITVKGYATNTANTPLIGAAPSSAGVGGSPYLQPVTATNAVYTYGASNNPMGAKYRGDAVNLVVRIHHTSGNNSTWYIDHATMVLYWDYPASGNALFFGENF